MNLKSIIKPHITEKSLRLAKEGWYTFEVAKKATKGKVKDAIESFFNVEVGEVKILNIKGKPKSFKRVKGKTSSKKKALVKLKKGNIDIFKVK